MTKMTTTMLTLATCSPTGRRCLGAWMLAGTLVMSLGCSRTPRRVQYYGPPGEEQPRRLVHRSDNQVQTVIGDGLQARLCLAPSTDWAEGQKIRLWRAGEAIGTALVMEVDAHHGATARVLGLTEIQRPIAPGDLVVPIELVREEREAPVASATAAATEASAHTPHPIDERAYYELAAKVLRLPAEHHPEVQRLQEELRTNLTPTLVPEAHR